MPAPASRLPGPLLDAAVAAVAAAMPVVRVLGETLRSVPPIEKGDGSPVTAADYAVQAIVVAGLRARLGGRVPLLGEEHADALASCGRPDAERLVVDTVRSALGWMPRADALRMIDGDEPRAGEPHWTIDPIDGTRGFILGAQCSICLAMIDGRDTALGVLGCPRMGPRGDLGVHLHGPGVVYGAVRGGGAFEWGPDGTPAPVVRAPLRGGPLRWARSLNRSANAMPSRLEPHLAAGGPLASSSMDSQCKYALVARDDADLVVRLPRSVGHRECVWDHASGTCIAAEAGASVSDVRGAALDFSHGGTLAANEGVLCVAPEARERVRAAVLAAAPAGAVAP
jgi:3'-phosphoadenosine 5'-phosphosulfate (PAPS) 3'-phosphatase